MKKVIMACFFAIIMLLIPITTSLKTAQIINNINNSSVDIDIPLFYISEAEYTSINSYIEFTFQADEEKKQEAYDIRDKIINTASDKNGYSLDIIKLSEALIVYIGIHPIPEDLLTIENIQNIDQLNGLIETYWKVVDGNLIEGTFSELVEKIIEIIKDRLGWMYDLVNQSYRLFKNGVALIYDFIQPATLATAILVVQVINNIIIVPQIFRDLIEDLFQKNFNSFIDRLLIFTENFADDLSNLLQSVINQINNQQLKVYFISVQDFVKWLDSKPWDDQIQLVGIVKYKLSFLAGGTVTCRGMSTTTDSNGRFNFSVDPSNADITSFPPNEWYGMHNCTIIISKDGKVLKQSVPILSYVFSGGKIDWSFIVVKSKSKYANLGESMMERFNNPFWRFLFFNNIYNVA